MADYGVLPTGFAIKPLSECKSELEALFHGTFGNGVSLDSATPEGQLIGIIAERESELWDMAGEVYASRDPDQATAAALSALCQITGTVGPQAATHSQLSAGTLGGTAGSIIPAGSQASVAGAGVKFQTLVPATFATVSAWVPSTVYAVGARAANGGSIYEVVTGGESAGSGGPSGIATDITDGTVHWRYLGDGDGAIDVAWQSVDSGPLAAPARTLSRIETPVPGWAWVTNAVDAAPGANQETDAALRVRRVIELAAEGAAALEAIRAQVLRVTGVTACTVFENDTMDVDAFSRPPKSIEVMVGGGADQDIINAIFASKASGIATYGTSSGTATDAQGRAHTIYFTRSAEIDIYVVVNLQKDPATWPADGEDQVKEALIAYGDANLAPGVDVVAFQLKRAITVSGVMDVPSLYIGTTSSPPPSSEAKIGITAVQQARLDTSRITVVATNFSDTP